jgi:hypothetical protein
MSHEIFTLKGPGKMISFFQDRSVQSVPHSIMLKCNGHSRESATGSEIHFCVSPAAAASAGRPTWKYNWVGNKSRADVQRRFRIDFLISDVSQSSYVTKNVATSRSPPMSPKMLKCMAFVESTPFCLRSPPRNTILPSSPTAPFVLPA